MRKTAGVYYSKKRDLFIYRKRFYLGTKKTRRFAAGLES